MKLRSFVTFSSNKVISNQPIELIMPLSEWVSLRLRFQKGRQEDRWRGFNDVD